MAAVSGKGRTIAKKSIHPSTCREDTISRKARELLVLVPKAPEREVESLSTKTKEDMFGVEESERTRVPAE